MTRPDEFYGDGDHTIALDSLKLLKATEAYAFQGRSPHTQLVTEALEKLLRLLHEEIDEHASLQQMYGEMLDIADQRNKDIQALKEFERIGGTASGDLRNYEVDFYGQVRRHIDPLNPTVAGFISWLESRQVQD